MPTYEICHIDASELMLVEADTAAKARYKNYLDWREAFNATPAKEAFMVYLKGIGFCRKAKKGA